MDPISIAMGLAKFAPMVAGWIGGEDAEKGAQKAVDIAQVVTGKRDPESALKELENNHEFAMKFNEAVMSYEVKMAKEETKRMQSVNQTMQAEARSEHWMQWSWRPFNGFAFGTTLFMNYALPAIANALVIPFIEGADKVSPGTIPEFVFAAWAAVLGVSSWNRGKEKVAKLGGDMRELVKRKLS